MPAPATGQTVFLLGSAASFMASLGTALGALPVLVLPPASRRVQDVLQSMAAGIMLAATALSLVVPGLAAATARTGSPLAGAAVLTAGVLLGSWAIWWTDQHTPHEHFLRGHEGPASRRLQQGWLFTFALTLHNVPEGMAVGVGYGGGDVANGHALALAIFLQNVPEGFLVALALAAAGFRRRRAVLVSCATGVVESVGGVVGAAAVAVSAAILPWAMGFAAGAMLYVISHEIIPETHHNGHEDAATFGLLVGFALMVLMNAAFQ
ncbi:MAG: ZIP family metal transporter [Anaeromyxobacter sp.]